MVGGLENSILPDPLPVASIALTTFIESSPTTSPKTTCLPSSQLVTTVVMKNWEPFLDEMVSIRQHRVGTTRSVRVGSSVGHGEHARLDVLQLEVLVREFLAVDGFPTGALRSLD